MRNRYQKGILIAGLLAAAIALPGAAYAGDENRAHAAIGSAQARIDTGEKLGVSADAADPQARARAALAEAQRKMRDDNEDAAYHAAQRAIALADLAIATAELKNLTAERDRLAAR